MVLFSGLQEENEGKPEIGHGGLLFLYVCVFGCFQVRDWIPYGQLPEKSL
jgi:hypothetical protein